MTTELTPKQEASDPTAARATAPTIGLLSRRPVKPTAIHYIGAGGRVRVMPFSRLAGG